VDDGDGVEFPTESLHTLNPSGMAPHALKLKVGAPIILLKNLKGHAGLSNGTRLILRGFTNRVIDAKIASTTHAGERVLLPRITLRISADIPCNFKRVQFPVTLEFSMTINKAQGQTLQHVGLFLQKEVFSHGHLYAAMSRATQPDRLKVMIPQSREHAGHLHRELLEGTPHPPNATYTKNVVYPHLLQ